MNKVTLIGNLARAPEHTTTSSGVSVCKFSIAVNRNFTNADGNREVDFFNIVTWRGVADNCAKYLTKGKKAAVSGRLETRSYEDKDGNKRYVTEIVADDVEFLSPKSESGETPQRTPVTELKPVESDDLPF